MATEPGKDFEQRALDKLNTERSWVMANKVWLIAIVVAAVLGFILAKIV